jgi:hypothetical protein
MRNTVKVNGVQLTRSQVEQALKELNTPVVLTSKQKHGMVRKAHPDSEGYMLLDVETVLRSLKFMEGQDRSKFMFTLSKQGEIHYDPTHSAYSKDAFEPMFVLKIPERP